MNRHQYVDTVTGDIKDFYGKSKENSFSEYSIDFQVNNRYLQIICAIWLQILSYFLKK